jgi:hypothetical protein
MIEPLIAEDVEEVAELRGEGARQRFEISLLGLDVSLASAVSAKSCYDYCVRLSYAEDSSERDVSGLISCPDEKVGTSMATAGVGPLTMLIDTASGKAHQPGHSVLDLHSTSYSTERVGRLIREMAP